MNAEDRLHADYVAEQNTDWWDKPKRTKRNDFAPDYPGEDREPVEPMPTWDVDGTCTHCQHAKQAHGTYGCGHVRVLGSSDSCWCPVRNER